MLNNGTEKTSLVPNVSGGNILRERIINETIFLIEKKGFSFTVNDLANGLSTSKRTIYTYFSSKNQLVEEVIQHLFSQIKEQEKFIIENTQLSLLEKIHQILIFVPKQFELMDVRLLADLKKYHYEEWIKLDRFLKEEWESVNILMEQAIKENLIKNINTSLFIEVYLGAINQIYQSNFASKNEMAVGEIFQSVVDMLLQGIINERRGK